MRTCHHELAPVLGRLSPRLCGRCGAVGHDVRACTKVPPSADALLARAEPHDDIDEGDAEIAAEAHEADSSPWDPDDMPAAPPVVTVPAARRSRARRPSEAQSAPLTLVMFSSADHGITVDVHALDLDDVAEAAAIVDTWNAPAILARGTSFVHIPIRVPAGLLLAAARRLRGAA